LEQGARENRGGARQAFFQVKSVTQGRSSHKEARGRYALSKIRCRGAKGPLRTGGL